MNWLLRVLSRNTPDVATAFTKAEPVILPYTDPYQEIIDRCQRHAKDPTVLYTTNRHDMQAVLSPHISAVIWVRTVSPELLEEVENLQRKPNLKDLTDGYTFGSPPPEGLNHLRADMRMIAQIRSELSGMPLERPILIARAKDQTNPATRPLDDLMTTDADFHADRGDVGLRLHTTYKGETIKGLSASAVERLRQNDITPEPIWKRESKILLENITEDDVIGDIPLYAVVAFKGEGYEDLASLTNTPKHLKWHHCGPDRERTDGVAAIFGVPYSTRYQSLTNIMEANI